jgi:DNA-binding protein YbaB
MSEVDDVLGRLTAQATRMRELADRMSAIRAEGTSADGAVTVVVDAHGAPVDVRLSSVISRMTSAQVEAAVVQAARDAAAQAFTQLLDVVDAASAGTDLVRIATARQDEEN